MARPCKVDTVEFQRKLSDADRAILLCAGGGCLTRGFHALLHVYATVHNAGFRPSDDISDWLFSDKSK
jgi:hypothetical protein